MKDDFDIEEVFDGIAKEFSTWKCRRCKRVYKCRGSLTGVGCPICDTVRGYGTGKA